jgi:outer membrane biosynthesis protein TonB
MPTTPPQTDQELPRPAEPAAEPSAAPLPAATGDISRAVEADAPLTFIPHTESGAVGSEPILIRTGRFGELEAHELVRLLDTIEDERARGRFRESVYISVFFWLAVAWFLFYGPRVLWHAPRVRLASDVLHDREVTLLNAPPVPHAPAPAKPAPPPRVDTRTLEHLREEARRMPTPTPAPNLPSAPEPTVRPAPSRTPPPVVAEAPTPQPSATRSPSFNSNSSASDNMSNLAHSVPRGSGYPGGTVVAPGRGGSSVGSGTEILSDTQGVDFTQWLRRFDRGTIQAWEPLLPEEIQPPLSKRGETFILLTVLPDGSIGDMKLETSSHDDAINRSAWGSITSQGKLQPLPSAFHGPNLVLRLHYMVNMDR